MSISPRGMSIQEAYRLFRDGDLYVNRKYQRKLVWTTEEKQRLINSINNGFPIPLILLAEKPQVYGKGKYEILDGVQRLSSIFSFIEQEFKVDNQVFDINQLSRASQAASLGVFEMAPEELERVSPEQCANFLDYQLAITVFPAMDEQEIIEVFGRINSGGKQLSNQERRQAGVVTTFSELVRKISAELRGDVTKELLLLSEMPEISIGSHRANQSYGLTAEEIFWCKQGVLWSSQLRDSEDEEMVADLIASILLHQPFERSKEALDELYDAESELYRRVEASLLQYSTDRIYEDIKLTFSVLKETIETYSAETNTLRNLVSPYSRNPVKNSFYTIFMSFFDLLVQKGLSPINPRRLMESLRSLQTEITSSAHYANVNERKRNIDKTIGLIQGYFVRKEPPALRHGPGLALDFENSLRRSKIETPRYEFKQGLLRLSDTRDFDTDLVNRIINTACGIANLGPSSDGYIFIGVADKKADAERVKVLDGIEALVIAEHYVVGIDREVNILKWSLDQYLNNLISLIKNSKLSEPLKTQLISEIDVITIKGLTVIRIKVPSQSELSFIDEDVYTREGNNTKKVESNRAIIAIDKLFQQKNVK